jgi:serine protease inhibitor
MMGRTERSRYAKGEGYQAVERAYEGGEVAMFILLPEAGRFEEFRGTLDTERVAGIVQDLAPAQAHSLSWTSKGGTFLALNPSTERVS